MSSSVRVNCPRCNQPPVDEEQPEPSLHAFSIKYKCGSQVVYVIGGDYWEWEKQCPAMKVQPAEIDDGK